MTEGLIHDYVGARQGTDSFYASFEQSKSTWKTEKSFKVVEHISLASVKVRKR